jgi:predicted nucleotidyltransferase
MRITKLQKEIIKTLLFFNLHKRPLASKEVYQYLGMKAQEGQVFLALLDLCRKKKVMEKNQFFVLKKYQSLFRNFNQRLKIKQKLETKAKKFLWLFKLAPFVRAVFLANSLAMGLPNKNSDIDLVILCKKNRLWTCRFFLVGLLNLFGLKRPKNVKIAPAKFCLSYFIDLQDANHDKELLKDDPYLLYWLATLKPLLGGRAIELFYGQNFWLTQYFPNLKIEVNNQKIKPLSFIAFLSEKILSLFGNQLENYLFKIQRQKVKAKNQKDTKFTSATICRLYEPDFTRTKIATKFKTELKKLLDKM